VANATQPKNILDIGTGTGVIALMLAQRFPSAKVTSIELDEDAAGQAEENFSESQFSDRLKLVRGRVQDFSSLEKFDLIASNPPFFPDHLKSQDAKRNKALHTDELSFEELIRAVCELLTEEGSFWVILPPRQMKILEILAEKAGLFQNSITSVKDNETKPVHREIGEFSFPNRGKKEREIVLKDLDFQYSDGYKSLIKGFLLGY
jgi:tRNA1Val (adenine37-N6)-methyltransferase